MALTQDQLMKMLGYGGLGSAAGGALGNMFGKSPQDSANKYLNQIPGQTNQYYQPYFDAGKNSLGSLQDQYSSLLGGPGEKLNDIGKNYQQSPGFKFALDQALGAGGRASAAGGMAGSPMHEQENMATATGLANQDYNNWMQNALGLYGQGLSGQQGLAGMGQQAGNNMANLIAQQLATQGQQAYEGQAAKNKSWSDVFGNIFGSLPFLF